MTTSQNHSEASSNGAQSSAHLLIGSTFSLNLIRRPVRILPCTVADLQRAASGRQIVSFWGHSNTLAIAAKFVGFDLTPSCFRPVLKLSPAGYPCYEGIEYHACWVVSPDYVEAFRPATGEEVPAEKIANWQVLQLLW